MGPLAAGGHLTLCGRAALGKAGLAPGMARAGRDGPPFSWDPHHVCGGRATVCALLCPHATLVLLGPPGLGCVLSLITQPPTQLLPWAPRILEAQLHHWLAEVRRQGTPLSPLLGWTHTISQLFLCGCGQCWRKRETWVLRAGGLWLAPWAQSCPYSASCSPLLGNHLALSF